MAFVLRHLRYLEISDIASTLQVSESTAKREIARAEETIEMRARSEPALSQYLHSLEEGRHV
jgi:DNA-directed RNA polymerase specialized sigma24 family protein